MRLDGFTEEQEVQLQEDIEKHGGSVIFNESKTMVDILVVPLNYECKKTNAKTVVRIYGKTMQNTSKIN